jgi:hypothetical protein
VTDRELFLRAFKALTVFNQKSPTQLVENLLMELEDRITEIAEQEQYYSMSKEARDKMRMAAKGNRSTWKPEYDAPYMEIKRLVATGVSVVHACKATGMSSDCYYRRRRIELKGRDR